MESKKSKGTKWDGKSRVSNDLYRKNYNKIFRKKSRKEKKLEHINLKEKYASLEPDPFDDYDKRKAKKILAEIAERNGF